MSSAYRVGCRLSRNHRMLQWFTYPPLGTIFTPADTLNNHILMSVCAFLNSNWNLWGSEEVRNLCMIADYIVDVYLQQEVIDLTLDEEPMEVENWIVLDEFHDQPEPEDVSETEESEEEFDSHSESDYSTSESEDSGVEV